MIFNLTLPSYKFVNKGSRNWLTQKAFQDVKVVVLEHLPVYMHLYLLLNTYTDLLEQTYYAE